MPVFKAWFLQLKTQFSIYFSYKLSASNVCLIPGNEESTEVFTTQLEDLVPEMSTEESTSERLRYDLTTSAESGEYICCYKFKYITFHVIFKDCSVCLIPFEYFSHIYLVHQMLLKSTVAMTAITLIMGEFVWFFWLCSMCLLQSSSEDLVFLIVKLGTGICFWSFNNFQDKLTFIITECSKYKCYVLKFQPKPFCMIFNLLSGFIFGFLPLAADMYTYDFNMYMRHQYSY